MFIAIHNILLEKRKAHAQDFWFQLSPSHLHIYVFFTIFLPTCAYNNFYGVTLENMCASVVIMCTSVCILR